MRASYFDSSMKSTKAGNIYTPGARYATTAIADEIILFKTEQGDPAYLENLTIEAGGTELRVRILPFAREIPVPASESVYVGELFVQGIQIYGAVGQQYNWWGKR